MRVWSEQVVVGHDALACSPAAGKNRRPQRPEPSRWLLSAKGDLFRLSRRPSVVTVANTAVKWENCAPWDVLIVGLQYEL
jgi:hypothetical protein